MSESRMIWKKLTVKKKTWVLIFMMQGSLSYPRKELSFYEKYKIGPKTAVVMWDELYWQKRYRLLFCKVEVHDGNPEFLEVDQDPNEFGQRITPIIPLPPYKSIETDPLEVNDEPDFFQWKRLVTKKWKQKKFKYWRTMN